MRRVTRFLGLGLLAIALTACSGVYRTAYDPVDPGVARGWSVRDVAVSVPETLTISEARSLVPSADIVWREDPATGERRAQVAAIVRDGARRGLSRLRGGTPVQVNIQVRRFHALTFEAERRLENAGVHNIALTVTVTDARTNTVLAGPDVIDADVPAFSGSEASRRRAEGETQKSVITNHLAATFAGWVGTGPDIRGEFSRAGD